VNIVAAILKLRRHIKNPTPSIDAYLLEEKASQISSRSYLKRRSFRLFQTGLPQHEQDVNVYEQDSFLNDNDSL